MSFAANLTALSDKNPEKLDAKEAIELDRIKTSALNAATAGHKSIFYAVHDLNCNPTILKALQRDGLTVSFGYKCTTKRPHHCLPRCGYAGYTLSWL